VIRCVIRSDTPEVVALAMNSRPTKKLKNTGMGITSINVFEEAIGIRVKEGNLEIVFKDTEDGAEAVRENRAYK
jgi:hypothetical protein